MLKNAALLSSLLAVSSFSSAVTADEYQEAYSCAKEALQHDSSPASFCVGNSRDPSAVEEKAYADAQRDSNGAAAQPCPFEFGIWMATGSRADGFETGAQLITTLTEAASLLSSGRDIHMYDASGHRVPNDIANRWFSQRGTDIALTQEATRTCSQKI